MSSPGRVFTGRKLLGEAELEVSQAAAEGHPLGGLTVLGELQGGSKLMTRRPQAVMLRFIWEALRKSWPLRLEKTRLCLCSRGLLSMTGSQKVTWAKSRPCGTRLRESW